MPRDHATTARPAVAIAAAASVSALSYEDDFPLLRALDEWGIAFFTDGDAGNDWLVIPLNQSNATTSYERPHLIAYATDGEDVWINAAPLAPGGLWKLNEDLRQGGGEVEIARWETADAERIAEYIAERVTAP
ncbi:hypothetical protein STAN_7197 [Streptomyces sp. CBMAI 2042]|uniref:hypothetical protein n=1 Tax=Streptomyces sp. CBMAI 2042 TaxID=2305222 RepID=UPI000F18E3EA|nr:hypothetical protein [Streptomyces sp. CBMAI 2042]RLV64377.1 hypothetical protein STAN_7197 [Streptomyces sp. CBMAI 2042]